MLSSVNLCTQNNVYFSPRTGRSSGVQAQKPLLNTQTELKYFLQNKKGYSFASYSIMLFLSCLSFSNAVESQDAQRRCTLSCIEVWTTTNRVDSHGRWDKRNETNEQKNKRNNWRVYSYTFFSTMYVLWATTMRQCVRSTFRGWKLVTLKFCCCA